MNIEDLKNIIEKNLEKKTNEVKRVFHGRGNFYDNFSYLTVDSFDNTLFATFFEESFDEKEIIKALEIISKNSDFENFIIQRKYKEKDFYEVIYGEIIEDFFVYENNLKYKIDFKILFCIVVNYITPTFFIFRGIIYHLYLKNYIFIKLFIVFNIFFLNI